MEKSKKIYTIAMGAGYVYRNTIENKVSDELLQQFISSPNFLGENSNENRKSYSVWGLSSEEMFGRLTKGDIVFFIYKQSINF
ncbi:hypothetical protein [Enterococcus faecalis]|uniref:hypothetical protein n=1 Tax=Enterococcus faecalis TaxID=1351 RepID=UPI0039A596A6